MKEQKTTHYRWPHALFAGLAFAVILSLVSSCLFLFLDLFYGHGGQMPGLDRETFIYYLSSAALSYLIGFGASLLLGIFLFVRMLRTQPTLLFMLVQAAILWLLMILLTLFPIFKAFLANPHNFPWRMLFFNDLVYLISVFEPLLFWLIAVVISWWLLRVIRIL